MNNHDELSYIKIMTRIMEEMSAENSKLKREMMLHRIILAMLCIIVVLLVIGGTI